MQAYSEGVNCRHGALVGMNTGAAEGAPVSDRGSVGMRTGTTEGAEENTSGGARHTAVGTQKGSTSGGARAAIGTGEHGASVGTTTGALEGALVWDGASIGTIMGGGAPRFALQCWKIRTAPRMAGSWEEPKGRMHCWKGRTKAWLQEEPKDQMH